LPGQSFQKQGIWEPCFKLILEIQTEDLNRFELISRICEKELQDSAKFMPIFSDIKKGYLNKSLVCPLKLTFSIFRRITMQEIKMRKINCNCIALYSFSNRFKYTTTHRFWIQWRTGLSFLKMIQKTAKITNNRSHFRQNLILFVFGALWLITKYKK
jgi:hypothetical protein